MAQFSASSRRRLRVSRFLKHALGRWQRDGGLDHPFGDRMAGEAGDLVDIELVHELLPMFFHRFDTDTEHVGNLFVGVTFRN